MKDLVFGELEWDGYGWSSLVDFDFWGSPKKIELRIEAEDKDEKPSEIQRDSYAEFVKKWDNIKAEVLEAILQYYQEEREELGYDVEENEAYPEVDDTEEILKMIEPAEMSICYTDMIEDFYENGRYIAIQFGCSWDEENGFGIILINEEVEEIGPDTGL